MSGHLSAAFFGGFQLHRDGELVTGFGYDKVKALLAYLVIEPPAPFERSFLAALLWPERTEDKARHSLRQALSKLRITIGEDNFKIPLILAGRNTIQRNPEAKIETDVDKFDAYLRLAKKNASEEIAPLELAIELYRGELLEGHSLVESASFEDWLLSNREHYQRLAVTALETIVDYYMSRVDYPKARVFAERWLAIQPWQEAAHRKLMLILARMGEQGLALKQYDRCQQVMYEEFELEPDMDTEKLYNRIRSMGALQINLPNPTTAFVGRREELGSLMRYLVNPDIRLITILGPGGMGKSRLAIQLGKQAAVGGSRLFLNGVFFVSLEGVREPERLITAIAQAVNYTFQPGEDPESQLIQYLGDKELLLILDNFEQIISGDSKSFLVSLLKEIRDLKLLVTSRQKINLRSEFIFQLGGLQIPDRNKPVMDLGLKNMKSYSAVEFLITVFKQMSPELTITEENIPTLVDICRLVEGMPLALELSASWTGEYPLEDIAGKISQSTDFLKADWIDVPARHRSIHAVIDVSWDLLEEQEQLVFMRLSVFQGGFTQQAAKVVTGAKSVTLSRLVSKSLVQYDSKTNRYRVHELLRQYGEERVEREHRESDKSRDRHGEHYAIFMESQIYRLMGPEEETAIREIEVELKNVITAWQWAARSRRIDILDKSAAALYLFYLRSARFQEGIAAFQLATSALSHGEDGQGIEILVRLTAYLGDLKARGEDWKAGIKLLRRSLEMIEFSTFKGSAAKELKAFILSRLGTFTHQSDEAKRLFVESLELYRDLGDNRQAARVLAYLGNILRTQGDLVEARQALEKSLAIQHGIGNTAGMIRTLSMLITLALRRGDLEEAVRVSQDTITLAKQEERPERLASSLEDGGIGYFVAGRFAKAEECFLQSLDIRVDLGQPINILISRVYLSWAYFQQGKFELAKRNARRVLLVAKERGNLPASSDALLTLGAVSLAENSYEESRQNFKECFSNYQAGWQHDSGNRRGIALAELALVDCHQGYLDQAREHLRQALGINFEFNSYIGLVYSLSGVALLLFKEGKLEKSIAIYEMTKTQPFVANSVWFEIVVGRHISKAQKTDHLRVTLDDLWRIGREALADLENEI